MLFFTTASAAVNVDASAQSTVEQDIPLSAWSSSYWTGYFKDFAGIVTAPLRFDKSDWLTTVAVLAVGGGLFAADRGIQALTQNNQSAVANSIANTVKPLGDWTVMTSVLAGGYLLSYAAGAPRLQQTTLLSLESVILSGVFVQVAKYTFHRHRPSSTTNPFIFDGPSFSGDSNSSVALSFPSGDAQVAFSIASVVAHEYADNSAVAPVAYGLATLVGLERIYTNSHWTTDVFFGSVIGYFTGTYLVNHHPMGKKSLDIEPTVSKDGAGVGVEYHF